MKVLQFSESFQVINQKIFSALRPDGIYKRAKFQAVSISGFLKNSVILDKFSKVYRILR